MRFGASGSVFSDFEDVVSTSLVFLPCILSNESGKVFVLVPGTRTLARVYLCRLIALVLKPSIVGI